MPEHVAEVLARVLYWEPNEHVEVLGQVGNCSLTSWHSCTKRPRHAA
jgi:hypothetical protein